MLWLKVKDITDKEWKPSQQNHNNTCDMILAALLQVMSSINPDNVCSMVEKEE